MRPKLAVVIALAIVAAPAPAHAQETAGYVVRLGADTLSVERTVRTPTQLKGESVTRSPRVVSRAYVADLAADGTVSRFTMTSTRLGKGSGPLVTRSTIVFSGDSAVTTAPRGDSTVTTRVAVARGTLPALFGVMGLAEQLGRQARRMPGTSDTLVTIMPGADQAPRNVVTERGGDTLTYVIETSLGYQGPWILRVDRDGRLLSFSGPGTPFQGETVRLSDVDIAAARTAFTDRPLGVLSARDTARIALGDSGLWVDYGRPQKRGRTVFGNVVSWNKVWRTGANAATQFHTPVDLLVGDATVPAGFYTLWTLPTPKGWTLIVNKQTGQWGTMYDATQDLVRVPMRVERLKQPVERFTIGFQPGAESTSLELAWDTTRASVPLRRK